MNKPKTTKDRSKELSTFFTFFLFVQLIIVVVFLLNGPIKSNFGYESIEAMAAGGPQGDRTSQNTVTPQQPRVIQPKNLDALKQNWTIPQPPPTTLNFIDTLEKKIFEESNTHRTNKNVQTVAWEDNLAGTARYHSGDMGTRNYFSHITPDDVGPFFRISKLHRRYIGTGGENILKITKDSTDPAVMARKIVDAWMNSTGHRQNILNPDYTALGVGVVEMPGQNNVPMLYATQLFGIAAAYLKQDFPMELSPGQEENVEIQCVHNDFQAPSRGEIRDLETRKASGFTLTEVPGTNKLTSTGKIKAPNQPGLYQLVFRLPVKKNPGTLAVIPGPIFTVKK
jgi:uncharacterized protein YkwD